jgi:class 3 adenylate cyclase
LLAHGDYFGGAVNLAARLLAIGERDELIATEPVVAAGGEERKWTPLGQPRIRGLDHPVDVYRLVLS